MSPSVKEKASGAFSEAACKTARERNVGPTIDHASNVIEIARLRGQLEHAR